MENGEEFKVNMRKLSACMEEIADESGMGAALATFFTTLAGYIIKAQKEEDSVFEDFLVGSVVHVLRKRGYNVIIGKED